MDEATVANRYQHAQEYAKENLEHLYYFRPKCLFAFVFTSFCFFMASGYLLETSCS